MEKRRVRGLRSVGPRVISRAASYCELPVRAVDDDEAAGSNSTFLRQPRANDDLEELAVDLADSFGEWRENSPTGQSWRLRRPKVTHSPWPSAVSTKG